MELLKKIWRPLLAFLLIFILVLKGPFDLGQLKMALTDPYIVTLGLSIFFAQQIFFSVRWKLFADLLTPIPLFKALQLTLVGGFFNYFIPGGVGGDIVKALELSKRKTITRSEALSTVMSDRVFGLFSMITFTLLFLSIDYYLQREQYVLKFLLLSAILFSGMTLSLLFLPIVLAKISTFLNSRDSKILNKIEKLVSSLHFTFLNFRRPGIQIKSFFISFACQLIAILFMFEVVRALGATPPSFLIFFSLCCFCFVAAAIPLFPAGIGVGQAAIYIMFKNISEEVAQAAIIAVTTLQVFNLFYALIGGAIFSFMPKLKEEDLQPIPEKT